MSDPSEANCDVEMKLENKDISVEESLSCDTASTESGKRVSNEELLKMADAMTIQQEKTKSNVPETSIESDEHRHRNGVVDDKPNIVQQNTEFVKETGQDASSENSDSHLSTKEDIISLLPKEGAACLSPKEKHSASMSPKKDDAGSLSPKKEDAVSLPPKNEDAASLTSTPDISNMALRPDNRSLLSMQNNTSVPLQQENASLATKPNDKSSPSKQDDVCLSSKRINTSVPFMQHDESLSRKKGAQPRSIPSPPPTAEDYAALAMAQHMGEWIIYEVGKTEECIDDWLKAYPPSTTKGPNLGWISIQKPSEENLESDEILKLKMMQEKWEEMQKSDAPITTESIKELAHEFNILGGKWLFHIPNGERVDEIWRKIARAIDDGRFAESILSAKVSPVKETGNIHEDKHVISCQTRDFTDMEDVVKADKLLRGIGIKNKLSYKPEIYSKIGIYRNNKYGISPTLLQSDFDYETGTSTVRDSGDSPPKQQNYQRGGRGRRRGRERKFWGKRGGSNTGSWRE